MACHKHKWDRWERSTNIVGWWRRECMTCGLAERKDRLSFAQWLWNLRP